MSTTKDLINAIHSKDASSIETAFGAAMAEKISGKLDVMRTNIAKNMFNVAQSETESEPVLSVEEEFENMTEEQLDEILTKKTPASKVISDFVHSDNPKFAGKSKKERIRQALGAYYSMHPEKSKK